MTEIDVTDNKCQIFEKPRDTRNWKMRLTKFRWWGRWQLLQTLLISAALRRPTNAQTTIRTEHWAPASLHADIKSIQIEQNAKTILNSVEWETRACVQVRRLTNNVTPRTGKQRFYHLWWCLRDKKTVPPARWQKSDIISSSEQKVAKWIQSLFRLAHMYVVILK